MIRRAALVALAVQTPHLAPAQHQDWLHQFGTNGSDFLDGSCPDDTGGFMACGGTDRQLGNDPPAGSFDPWVARFDSAGVRVWLRQIGTAGVDSARAIAPDGAGGVFVVGDTVEPGAIVTEGWMARYGGAGNRVWYRRLAADGMLWIWDTCSDNAGGFYVCGQTRGDLGGPVQGASDGWLARYNGAGGRLWLRQIGPSRSLSYLLPCEPDGVVVSGAVDGDMVDAWFARYSAAGEQVWSRQIGTSGYDSAGPMARDGAEGFFVAAFTCGGLVGPPLGNGDVWLARYTWAGDRLWEIQFGTPDQDIPVSAATDGAGGLVLAGNTTGSMGGPFAGGDYDVWVARYDGESNRRWVRQIGTEVEERCFALAALDGGDAVVVGGHTYGSLGGPVSGPFDAWMARYDLACAADWNGDTLVNSADINAFLTVWLDGVGSDSLAADFNGDLAVNSSDISAFLTAWRAAVQGGC